jgi:death on curing protein
MTHAREPRWLDRLVIEAIHFDQILTHGGLPGLRDEAALESALARPRQRHSYEPESDLAALAASYGFGLARNHPFHDGNKRIAFMAIVVFLGLNGYELDATEADVVTVIVALAAGRLTEEQLGEWVRSNATEEPRGSRPATP